MLERTLGPYRIDRELGSGGMGAVYAATVVGRAPGLPEGSVVAVKVVHPFLLETSGFFKRFLREAEIGKRVRHPNVVRTFDVDAIVQHGEQVHFMVLEYVEGQTLRQLMDEMSRLPEELCRHVGREVAKGLQAIHSVGVIHRDIKPENIIITLSAEGGADDNAGRPRQQHVVKVMDLGVARLQEEAIRLSQTGAFVGSVHYAAPEQFGDGVDDLDARADLHALGVVLYELATGVHPVGEGSLHELLRRIASEVPRRIGELNPQLTPFFEEAVHKLLKKDRAARFRTAAEVASTFELGESSPWWELQATSVRLETRRPLRRVRIPRETALYGRGREIEQMRALYGKAKSGAGQVLLVEGEAGIGKTRLVDEFVAQLVSEGEDLSFLFGSYPPGGAATTAGAFSTAYREQFGESRLEDTLREYLAETPALIPAFAALLRGDATPEGSEPLTKESMQTLFVHATRALAVERPTIVLVDDLHFAPAEGRALFAALAQALAGDRVLLVGTARRYLPGEWTANIERLDVTTRIPVERLGPKDLTLLLKDLFRSERLARSLAFRIAEKSDGNPFFVFEIVRGLREHEQVQRAEDGSWVSTGVIGDIAIPSSVRELVRARMEGIGEESRDLLEVASCCGFDFDPLLVGQVLGMGDIPLLKRLGRIEHDRRLVRSVGRRYVFDHHQVQEALYEGVSPLLRERYHAALGDALESRVRAAGEDEPAGAVAVELCGHFLAGGAPARAAPFLSIALDHLGSSHLNEDTIGLADRALGVKGLLTGTERLDVILRKVEHLNLLGRRDEQQSALDEALRIAEELADPARRADVRNRLGRLLHNLSRNQEAVAILEAAATLAQQAGDLTIEGRIRTNLGHALRELGRTEEALRESEARLELAERTGRSTELAAAHGNLGHLHKRMGRLEEALACHRKDLAIQRAAGERRSEAMALGNVGGVLEYLGRHDEARAMHEECMAIARELGDRRTELIARFAMGTLDMELGRLDAAREAYERVLGLAREIRYTRAEAAVAGNLALIHRDSGRIADALEANERQLELNVESGRRVSEAVALANVGDIRLLLGDLDGARTAGENGLAICREAQATRVAGYVLESLADIAEQSDDPAEAERLHREATASRRESGYVSGLATSLAALGGLLVEQERGEEARPLLEEVIALGERAGSQYPCLRAEASLAIVTGDPTAALAAWAESGKALGLPDQLRVRRLLWKATGDLVHLSEAHAILALLRDNAPEEYRDPMIENVPLHREIWEAMKNLG